MKDQKTAEAMRRIVSFVLATILFIACSSCIWWHHEHEEHEHERGGEHFEHERH